MEAYGQVKGRKYPDNHAEGYEDKYSYENSQKCCKCKKILPLDMFEMGTKGLKKTCTNCQKKHKRDQERLAAKLPKSKVCSLCKRELPQDNFYIEIACQRLSSYCRECANALNKKRNRSL